MVESGTFCLLQFFTDFEFISGFCQETLMAKKKKKNIRILLAPCLWQLFGGGGGRGTCAAHTPLASMVVGVQWAKHLTWTPAGVDAYKVGDSATVWCSVIARRANSHTRQKTYSRPLIHSFAMCISSIFGRNISLLYIVSRVIRWGREEITLRPTFHWYALNYLSVFYLSAP